MTNRVGTVFIIFSVMFLLFLLSSVAYESFVTKDLPSDEKQTLNKISEKYRAFGEQRGGTVTPDYTSPVEYTNDTNRYIHLKLTHDQITEKELQLMKNDDLTFTIKAIGNALFYKQTYPLKQITDKVFSIHLNDGRLDDYRVCVWFNDYDGKQQCVNYSKKLNVTNNEIDISYNLLYVHEDIKSEEEDSGEDSR